MCFALGKGLCLLSHHVDKANVRRPRYLHARILLLRPIVAEYHLKQPKPSQAEILGFKDRTLSQGIVDECLTQCFGAAHETIDMIYTHLDRETVMGPTPAWWFSVLCKNTLGCSRRYLLLYETKSCRN